MPSTDHGAAPPDTPPSRGAPGPLLVAAALAAAFYAVGWLSWHPLPIGVWHDDGAYVLVAESIAAGDGLTWSGVSASPPAAKFPPLFPVVASSVLRWGPDMAQAAVSLGRVNIALMAAAGAVFFLFLVYGIRLPYVVGAGAAGLIWTAPALWRLAAVPLSEPLFMLACSSFLLVASKLEARWSNQCLASVVLTFAAAYYTRTVGIVLIGAVALAYLWRRQPRRAVVLAGPATLVMLPWIVWSRAATQAIPEPLRDVLGSYGGWLSGEMIRAPTTYIAFTMGNAWAVWIALVGMAVPASSGSTLSVLAMVLLPIAFYGLMALAERSPTAAAFVVLYSVVIALWPFQSPRLVTPVLPCFILSLGLGVWRASRIIPKARQAVLAVAGLFAIAFGAANVHDLWRGEHLAQFDARARALAAAAEAVNAWVPADAVVGAPELWAGVHIYTGRTVSPSARFLPLASDGPSWGTPDQQYELWDAAGIDHVLVEHGGGVHGAALDRMDATCPGGAVELIATMPGALLTRLNWDATCREALQRPEGGSDLP